MGFGCQGKPTPRAIARGYLCSAPYGAEIRFVKVESQSGEQFFFDLKTVKPNKGDFQKYKQTLLEWAGIALTANKDAKIHTLVAIPYNPYEPQPYKRWTMAGMLDLPQELMFAEEFWDFLGGEETYQELLDCFEQAGIELRPEIDDYFGRFNT
jgi:type II restriction enzyme